MREVVVNYRRVLFLFAGWLCLGGSVMAADNEKAEEGVKPPRKPNIILILADDLGYGDIGAYGANSKMISTLSLNRVYLEGRRYLNAYAPSAVCSPTRFSVLSGTYPWRGERVPRHLTASEPFVFKRGEKTVASLLKDAGYATACIGKWHLGAQSEDPINWNEPLKPGPNDVGFDYFFGVINSHNQAPYVWVENDQVFGRQAGETIEVSGNTEEVSGIQLKRRNVEIAATLAQKTKAFMEANKDKPFFLYYPTCTVHSPHEPASFVAGKSKVGAYGDSVMEFDWLVSQVLRNIGRLGLHQDTLLVITSDNGANVQPAAKFDHKSNGDLRGQKAQIFEGGTRVPFLVRWEGKVPNATDSKLPISLADLPATFLHAAGVPVPHTFGPDSCNILPDFLGLTGEGTPVRPAVVTASKFQDHLAIRDGDWKLIVPREPAGDSPLAPYKPGRFGPGEVQLFNLAKDPGESRDVFAEHTEIAERLAARLAAFELQGHSRPGYEPARQRD